MRCDIKTTVDSAGANRAGARGQLSIGIESWDTENRRFQDPGSRHSAMSRWVALRRENYSSSMIYRVYGRWDVRRIGWFEIRLELKGCCSQGWVFWFLSSSLGRVMGHTSSYIHTIHTCIHNFQDFLPSLSLPPAICLFLSVLPT